jgi:hypothetical protein
MTSKVKKELVQDVSAFGPTQEPKKAGDVVEVSAHVVADNPQLFADIGEGKRRIKSSGDTVKLQKRIDELEKQNKALLNENQMLKKAAK